MARKRKKKQIESVQADQPAQPKRRFFGKLSRIIFVCSVFFAVMLAAAPMLICKTPLFGIVVNLCLPETNGQIVVGSGELGWLTPVSVNDIVVSDQHGEEIGRVKSIATSKNLLNLLQDRQQLGTIQINSPDISIQIDDGISNWETVFASADETKKEPHRTTPLPSAVIQIVDGNLQLKDPAQQQSCRFQSINGSVDLGATDKKLLTSNIDLDIANGEQVGKGSVQLSTSVPTDDAPFATHGQLKLQLSETPLSFLGPLAKRLNIELQITGSAKCDLSVHWDQTNRQFGTQGRVDLAAMEFSCPQVLEETVWIQQASFDSNLRCENNILFADKASLESSIGNANLTGNIPLDAFSLEVPIPQLISSIREGQAKLTGQIDVAALAQTLPNTLKIREDTEVTAGQISIDVNAIPSENGVKMSGFVHTSDLTALNRGREVSWKRPIQTDFQIVGTENQLRIDKLICRSTFFSLGARGSFHQGSMAARADLQRFQNQFQQLFDFRDSNWNGIVQLQCRWQKKTDDLMEADGAFHAENLQVDLPNSRSIDERLVDGRFRSRCLLDGLTFRELQAAECKGSLSADRFSISLANPLSRVDVNQIALNTKLGGQLTSWNSRLANLGVAIPTKQLEGGIDLSAGLKISNQAVVFEPINATLERLILQTETIQIDEPSATVTMSGQYGLSNNELTIPNLAVSSTTISASAKKVRVDLKEPPTIEGEFDFQGELGRFERVFLKGAQHQRLAGTFEGSTHLKASAHGIDFDGHTRTKNLRIRKQPSSNYSTRHQNVPASSTLWDEPVLRLGAKGIYDPKKGDVTLDQLTLQTEAIGLAAQGAIRTLNENTMIDIQGKAAYDLGLLAERFRTQLGNQIEISGKAEKPFQIRGPLFATNETTKLVRNVRRPEPQISHSPISDRLEANAGFGWDKAKVYGLDIDSGELSARLVNRRLLFDPLNVRVGSGTVNASPILDLRRSSPELIVRQGRVLENIELSPELCENWLKYVAPLVANATKAEGKFSVDMNSARLPFDRPMETRVGGTLAIHQGQVGPGSLSKRLLAAAEQLKGLLRQSASSRIIDPERAWLTLPEQQVAFAVRNGQVGHQGLKMMLSDIPVETSGWVTLDERLQMEATFPIQKEWLGNDRYLAMLEGQTLTIPITGTISRPKLDRRGFRNLTKQAATKAAEGMLKEEIGNQLQRLFRQK